MDKLELAQAANKIKTAIDSYVKTAFPAELRNHLGGSEIGKPCDRELWYKFRWVAKSSFRTMNVDTGEYIDDAGRMARLFQRGHSEEERMISYLRGAGIEVSERDTSKVNEKGDHPQYRISGVGGHFGGSLDGKLKLPEWILGFPAIAVLEMKTHGKKSFEKLKKFGLGNFIRGRNGAPFAGNPRVKEEHVCQMDTYGTCEQIPYGVYVAIEKDTDDIYIDVRETNFKNGREMLLRAAYIIRSKRPPDRLAADPNDWVCKFCEFKSQCHEGASPTEINCRSCKFSEPIPGAAWICNANAGRVIPPNVIVTGCKSYAPVSLL